MDIKTEIIYDQNGRHIQSKEYTYGPNTALWTLVAEEVIIYGANGLSMQWSRIEKNATTWDTTQKMLVNFDSQGPVSYTHLTLPTIYSV